MTELQNAIDQLLAYIEAEHAVVSPGSRNAPVIQGLINQGYRLHSVVDERSAAFQALGMSKSLRQAVVLSCTSGTAVLNYYPAIAEAFYARVPLIVITADRPPESIDQWEGQAIRQKNVFESHCRLSLETPHSSYKPEDFVSIAQKVNTYLEDGIKGPIHINVPIREPFYASDNEEIKQEFRSFTTNDSILLLDLDDYLPTSIKAKNILVFNGMEDGQLMIVQCKDGESYENLVVLSDITSNQASSVLHWDAMLTSLMRNSPAKASVLQPYLLITTGTTSVSKGLKQLLKKYKPEHHFHFSRHPEIGDPFGTKPIQIDPYSPTINRSESITISSDYQKVWASLSNQFIHKMIELDWNEFTEFSACKYVLGKLPMGCIVHFANSMSVRLGSYLVDEMASLEVYANRGTSGIDGCTSTALGSAIVSNQTVYLITGDVAFLYDINALYRSSLPPKLKIIILNNQGGRIFEMIDGPNLQPNTLTLQRTAQNRSIRQLCTHFGLEYFCAENYTELNSVFLEFKQSTNTSVLEIKTDHFANLNFYTKFKNIIYD